MVEKIIDNRWKAVDILGQGGNAIVYKVSDITKNDDIFYALKVITKEQPDKKRLRIEIDTQKEFTDAGIIGVLPLLEYSFPENPTEQAPIWLLMPIAESMRVKIEKGNLYLAVVALLSISRTLLKCASYKNGFLHRDIKPENIFFYNGNWCIGDFGLVDFDGKENITKDSDRIGATNYIAPECFAPGHDFTEKSEVYALAKTIFAIVTGQKYPNPGAHYITQAATCIEPRNDDFVMSANHLLEKSTRDDKEKRIGLAIFIDELEKCLQLRLIKLMPAKELKIDDSLLLYKQKLEIIDAKNKTIQEKEDYVRSLNDKIWYELERLYASELRKYSNECMRRDVIFMMNMHPFFQINPDIRTKYLGTYICVSNNPDGSGGFHQFHIGESFHAGMQIILLPEDRVQIIAGISCFCKGEPYPKWSFGENRIADLYSPDEKILIKECINEINKNFSIYFPEFIQNMKID